MVAKKHLKLVGSDVPDENEQKIKADDAIQCAVYNELMSLILDATEDLYEFRKTAWIANKYPAGLNAKGKLTPQNKKIMIQNLSILRELFEKAFSPRPEESLVELFEERINDAIDTISD